MSPHHHPTDPALMGAEQLLSLYATRALSPVEVLKAVTERIARYNPWVNAFAALNPRALRQAGESEARWRAGRPVGPLDGVPATVQDLLHLEGFPTRRGSRATDAAPLREDAPAVLALKTAGAVILGKTTSTEFGWKVSADGPLHGITRNPWNPRRGAGGAASGAGAAGAACFGPLHLGLDAGGSLRIPAAHCGLVGMKPTQGRVPQWPRDVFAGLSSAGPLARGVRDAALMLGALALPDPRDPFCLEEPPRDWREGIEEGVRGMRIALVRRPGLEAPLDPEGEAALERAAHALREAGATVEEADPGLPDLHLALECLRDAALARLVAATPPERRERMEAGLREAASRGDGLSAVALLEAEAVQARAAHAMSAFHLRHDAVLTACTPTAAFAADLPDDDPAIRPAEAPWRDGASWTAVFGLTRQPAVSVPAGLDAGNMPRAVQVVAARNRDDLALLVARALERALALPFFDAAARAQAAEHRCAGQGGRNAGHAARPEPDGRGSAT